MSNAAEGHIKMHEKTSKDTKKMNLSKKIRRSDLLGNRIVKIQMPKGGGDHFPIRRWSRDISA